MLPSIRDAGKLSARELDAEIRRLTAVVRDGKAPPAELGSGRFTLNNYGVFGVDGSGAIINHPDVLILGVDRIMDKPWVVDSALAFRKVTKLTLTFDHRVCDGGTAARPRPSGNGWWNQCQRRVSFSYPANDVEGSRATWSMGA